MRRPHLACDADLSKLKLPLMLFPKIDGVRMMHINGSGVTGRSLDAFANLHTTALFSNPLYAGIDGEAAAGEITSNSLCRDTTSALNTIKGEPSIIWHGFDFIRASTEGMTYIDRYSSLETYVNHHKLEHVRLIPWVWVKTIEEIEHHYQKHLAEGYEGVILRNPVGKHKDGRCTAKEGAYLRMKPSSDKEALCIRIEEAMENQNEAKQNTLGRTERSSHKKNLVGKGMVGALVCVDPSGKVQGEFNVSAGTMTHPERIDFFNNPNKLVNQFIKYQSMDTGVKDKPRFARFLSVRARADMS